MADWAKLKVVDLKAELKRRGLPQGGLKMELIARLNEAVQDTTEPESQPESQPEPQPEPQPDSEKKPVDEPPPVEPETSQTVNGNVAAQAPEVQEQTKDQQLVIEKSVSEAEPEPEPTPQLAEPAQEPSPTAALVSEAKTETKGEIQPEPELEPEVPTPSAPKESHPEASPPSRESQLADSETPMHDSTPEQVSAAAEAPAEVLKRKRRSASPTPKEEDVFRKRARAGNSHGLAPKPYQLNNDLSTEVRAGPPVPEVDYDRHVEPSVHPATSALCINNLMRPLRPADLRAHIVTLATAPGTTPSDDIVTKFYLDFIRTHAFVALDSVSAASRVRQLLHGRVWPNESNRKALSIDFIPLEKMDSWIGMEEEGGRRPSHRWEVVYAPSADGSTVEADLVSNSLSSSASTRPPPPTKPPPMAAADIVNSAPLGPRGNFTDSAPPTGPRGPRRTQPPPPPPPPPAAHFPSGEPRFTRTRPSVAYHLVPEDLARRRVDNMRTFYTRELNRDMGREINRYSFEDGDSFVDRGREIFEGIRPPHRERGARGGRGRGAPRARGAFRPRSDRYIPGTGGGRDDGDRRRY
ncbi:SAP domain-containing protein [Metarhizium rileyi]|uniref:SAP domain-containing protein n=1 Tax=Metarhizium rileyi (strain RCEF 4871) TaxID=1649241 RepID=A0A167EC38_METRR|nr:SAP domain-containing protein [Metarhizium rileyi RCEF 4871]